MLSKDFMENKEASCIKNTYFKDYL